MDTSEIELFSIQISQEALEDLRLSISQELLL